MIEPVKIIHLQVGSLCVNFLMHSTWLDHYTLNLVRRLIELFYLDCTGNLMTHKTIINNHFDQVGSVKKKKNCGPET